VRILSIERSYRPNGGRYKEIARFDVQIVDELRVYRVRLLENPDGTRIVQAPQLADGKTATFGPALARKLTLEAGRALADLEGTSHYVA
jgi:hypothetical protein